MRAPAICDFQSDSLPHEFVSPPPSVRGDVLREVGDELSDVGEFVRRVELRVEAARDFLDRVDEVVEVHALLVVVVLELDFLEDEVVVVAREVLVGHLREGGELDEARGRDGALELDAAEVAVDLEHVAEDLHFLVVDLPCEELAEAAVGLREALLFRRLEHELDRLLALFLLLVLPVSLLEAEVSKLGLVRALGLLPEVVLRALQSHLLLLGLSNHFELACRHSRLRVLEMEGNEHV